MFLYLYLNKLKTRSMFAKTVWQVSKYGVFLARIRENADQKKLHILTLFTV